MIAAKHWFSGKDRAMMEQLLSELWHHFNEIIIDDDPPITDRESELLDMITEALDTLKKEKRKIRKAELE